jgi:pimeloyl-ACP methyl ester carboxylesterase
MGTGADRAGWHRPRPRDRQDDRADVALLSPLISRSPTLREITRGNAAGGAIPVHQLRAQAQAVEGFDVTGSLACLGVPTPVMVGAEDLVTPVGGSVALVLAAPRAELVVLPQGGHPVSLETPGAVTPRVLDFLDRNALIGCGTVAMSSVAS